MVVEHILNVSGQLSVEILKADDQLAKRWPFVGRHCPTISHNGEQLVGAIYRLRQSVAVSEVGSHLERVHLHVRLLCQRGQFP